MKRAILICGCAALALSACSKKADTGAAPSASAPAPVAAAPAAPPTRKGGLWEQAMDMGQMKQTIRMCVDEASEAKTKWWSTERHGGQSNCAEQSVTPTPGGWAFHSVCTTGDGGKVTSDGTATGDFGTHYKVEMTAVTSGSAMAQANGTHKMSMEGSWKGPCPAGMKPGDMEMPGGMRISTSGGAPHMQSGPGGVDIAKMKAQAEAMKAQAKP
jgi:hypothetical protein